MVIKSVTISVNVMSEDNFSPALERNVNASHVKVTKTHTMSRVESQPNLGNVYSTCGNQVDSETLVKYWNTDQHKALNTVK